MDLDATLGGFDEAVMLERQAVSCCRRIHGLSCARFSSLSWSSKHPRVILAAGKSLGQHGAVCKVVWDSGINHSPRTDSALLIIALGL